MARHQVHRSRWIACRRRSAAPSITILVFSRGKTVEKCAVGRPPGFLLIPSREALRWAIDDYSPGWVSECEKTQASLMKYREALLTFHRESKRARYSKKKAAASQHPRAL